MALQATDLLTTAINLALGNREGNPIMGLLLAAYGWPAVIGYKALVCLVAGLVVQSLGPSHPRPTAAILGACNVMVALTVLSNCLMGMLAW